MKHHLNSRDTQPLCEQTSFVRRKKKGEWEIFIESCEILCVHMMNLIIANRALQTFGKHANLHADNLPRFYDT